MLKLPSVLLRSENQPNAAFATPVVTLRRALVPSAVLNVPPTDPGSGVSGAGAACAPGKNARQTISSGMSKEPRCEGASLLEFLRVALEDVTVLRIIFFIVSRSCRARGFLEIRRITYECSCPTLLFSVKKADRKTLCLSQISTAWRRWLGKLNVENRTAAAVVALETYRSAALAPESKPGQAWAAIAGFFTTQLCAVWSDSCELYDEIARLAA